MYVAVAVGSIQEKSRFTVAEGYPIRIMLKGRWDINWFKNPQGLVPQANQPNLFLALKIIYVFVIEKSNHVYLHILHHFC